MMNPMQIINNPKNNWTQFQKGEFWILIEENGSWMHFSHKLTDEEIEKWKASYDPDSLLA